MPIAEKFNALGVGNGFMSCLPKNNVSGVDHWITFSGWSKENTPASDAEKAASIAESRRLAMLFYWNSYKLSVTQTETGVSVPLLPQEVNAEDDARTPTGGAQDALPPKSRVCRTDNHIKRGGEEYLLFEPFGIARMYDGDVTNEDNLVGFGLYSSGYSYAAVVVNDDWTGTYISLYSDVSTPYWGDFTDYTTLPIVGSTDELHCICDVECFAGDEQEFFPTERKVRGYDEPPSTYEVITQIDSLELYTYPT